MTTTLERAARALLEGHNWANGDCAPNGWDEVPEDWKQAYRNMARSLLLAIREPDEGAIEAATATPGMQEVDAAISFAGIHGFKLGWKGRGELCPIAQANQAIIDSILEQGGE